MTRARPSAAARIRRGATLALTAIAVVPTLTACANNRTHHQTNANATDPAHALPAGILTDPDKLGRAHKLLKHNDPDATQALKDLKALAEEMMELPIRPITAGKEDGKRIAPSGDPHDYVSLSPYWWPNPESPNGEPYYRRDGEVNPERYEYDTPKLDAFGKAVRTLAFAYEFTGDQRYADRAIEHVRAWFVNPDTRMHPRMKYSQFVPGVASGRRVGIIDTNRLRWVPDAIIILSEAPGWTDRDTRECKRWFGDYARWLMTSDLGTEERNSENNHGTWFAAQTVLYALFAGDETTARELLETIPPRIDQQIEPTGLQPHEAVRTQALHYHDFNVRGMLDLAVYGDIVGVDIKNYVADDGSSLRAAIDFLVPYMLEEKEWPYQQITDRKIHLYYQSLRRASLLYDEPRYERAAQQLNHPGTTDSWVDLVVPPQY